MNLAGVALLGRRASRVHAGLTGKVCSTSSRAVFGFSASHPSANLAPSIIARANQSLIRNPLLSPLRISSLRTVARIAAPPQQQHAQPSFCAAAAAAAVAAAPASIPAASRCLSSSSSSSSPTAADGSSNGASAAGGQAVGDSTGVENEGAEEKRQLQQDASQPPDSDDLDKLKAELAASREASAAANAKVRELQDKLLRALAEQENARGFTGIRAEEQGL
ncbi:hypothetical protein Emag_005588 [Eimeria magna]